MTKKIVASAGILAAITALITGAATYASLSTRTESVINSFQGACVNIGVVEKNNTGDVLVLEDEGTDDNGVYGENNSNNINIYEKISEDERTAAKEVSVKNITSENYPTTDTCVRVRLVPMLVYDDNEVTRKAGVAGQTVPADLRNNVEYVLSDGVDVIADLSEININAADKRCVYNENETGDVNDRYYYYMAPLAPDEVSSCLLKAVTYKGALPADTHFELRVLAEGIARVQLEYVR